MRIGELAQASGFSIDTLRWYDRIGLVRPARRNAVSGFREYGRESVDMLALVRLAKVAGLPLPQIRRILAAARRGAACDQVVPLLDRKIGEIDLAIRALQDLRGRLVTALKHGRGKRAKGCSCPILTRLGQRRGPGSIPRNS